MNNINLGNYGENTDFDHELFVNVSKDKQSRQPEIQSNHRTRYVLFGKSQSPKNINFLSIPQIQKPEVIEGNTDFKNSIKILNLYKKYNVNPPNPRIFTLQAESESSSKFRPKTYRIKKFRNSKAKFFRNNNNNSVVQGNQSPTIVDKTFKKIPEILPNRVGTNIKNKMK